ncbi:hypothetical protein [Aliivibrio fischeri]|uniref:hypothetical protein n=1 Tax=Aliivibrio fischeri TaxID=668 RepID=UPI0010604DF2|nr:hypothetical protein [Aliivibrio fischeri]TDM51367.1 hypothetical protein VFFQA001_14645 [Aliivibrio fischeri]
MLDSLGFFIFFSFCFFLINKNHLVFSYKFGKMKSRFDTFKFFIFCIFMSSILYVVLHYLFADPGAIPLYIQILLTLALAVFLGTYFLCSYNCNYFIFTKTNPFCKNYNIHLSNTLIDEIKKIRKNNPNEARELLIKNTNNQLIYELNCCFNDRKVKSIIMKSHHIGRKKQKNEMIIFLNKHGFSATPTTKISSFECYYMAFLLSISFKNLKPFSWEFSRLDIVKK